MPFAKRAQAALGLCSALLLQCGGPTTPEPESPTPASRVTYEPTAVEVTSTPESLKTPERGTSSDEANPRSAKTASLDDHQVAGINEAANDAEIAKAKVAQGKSSNPRVKRYTAMVISAYTQAKDRQARFGVSSADTVLGDEIGVDAGSALRTMKQLSGAEFDRAYITAQVSAQRKFLEALDETLIPSAKNPELKLLLEEMRPRVARQLREAEELQSLLGPDSGSTPSSGKSAP